MMGRDLCWLIVPVLLVGGCAKSVDNGAAANNSAQAPVVETLEEPDSAGTESGQQAGLPTDEWAGRWNGPEGLFLDIQPSPNGKPRHYAITNRDTLDRQGDYAGVAEGATIRFVREGQQLTIRPGTGEETGFKYLAGKTDCLIMVAGQEGYCR